MFTREDVSDLPVPDVSYHGDVPLDNLHMTPEEVAAKLGKLCPGSSLGPNKIYPHVLNSMKLQLSIPLAIIFNKSLKEGVVPLDWKNINMTPIFKKDRNMANALQCLEVQGSSPWT